MSFFLCKYAKLEAEPVMLAGEQYYAVAVYGKGHLVHGPAFDLLFQPVVEQPAAPVEMVPVVEPAKKPAPVEVRKQQPAKGKTKAAVPVKQTAVPVAKASPMQQRVLDILASGPLTTVDLALMVYPELDRKTACMNIYPLTGAMKDKGLIEKREDPTAGDILKWYAV